VSLRLDQFIVLDARMKDLVTAWQIRDAANQVFNDHSERGVRRLCAGETRLAPCRMPWNCFTSSGPSLWRMACYRDRLERALTCAPVAATRDSLASVRVDSYHSIWFELHEDLIRLSGRSRGRTRPQPVGPDRRRTISTIRSSGVARTAE